MNELTRGQSLQKKIILNITKKRNFYLLLLILLLSVSLRIYHLGKNSFWYDEAISLAEQERYSFIKAIQYGQYNTDPPLFTFILYLCPFLKQSEFTLRLLPLFFSVLGVLLIYAVGKTLFNKNTGLVGAFILAICPFHIYYAQELRQYSLFTFLALASIYYYVKANNENNRASWINFTLWTSILLYSHNYALFLLIAENIHFFIFQRREIIKKWLTSQVCITLLYLPWLVNIIWQLLRMNKSDILFWVAKFNLCTFLHTLNIFNLGYNANRLLYLSAAIIFFPLFINGIFAAFKDNRKAASLLLLTIATPFLLIGAASIFFTKISTFLYRAIIYVSPAYYILVSHGILNAKKYIYLFVLGCYALLSFFSLQNYYQDKFPLPVYPYRPGIFEKKDTRSAAQYVFSNFQDRDLIAHTSRATLAPFLYYHNEQLDEKWVGIFQLNTDSLHWRNFIGESNSQTLAQTYIKYFFTVDIRQVTKNYARIWLVLSGWELDVVEEPQVKEWLDNNANLISTREFKGIKVYLYKTGG